MATSQKLLCQWLIAIFVACSAAELQAGILPASLAATELVQHLPTVASTLHGV